MFKRTILLPVLGTVALLLCTFVGIFYWQQQRAARQITGQFHTMAEALLNRALRDREQTLEMLLRAAVTSRHLNAALKSGNMANLRAALDHHLHHWRVGDQAGRLTVTDPAGIPRVVLPHGPAAERAVTGLIREHGHLELRVSVPWPVAGTSHPWTLSADVDGRRILRQLEETLGAELVLVDDANHALLASTLHPLPASLARPLMRRQLPSQLRWGGQRLYLDTLAIRNYGGHPVARLIVLRRIPLGNAGTRTFLLLATPLGLALALGLALFFHRLISRVERQVAEAQDELEQTVAERTAALRHEMEGRAEEQEQLRLLSRAVEQSPVSVMITDTRGTIEYANPQFYRITGYSPAEVLGQNPRIVKSGETSAEEYRVLWTTLLAGRDWRGEFCNRRKDGSPFYEATIISPVRTADGVIRHFVAVKEDISARKIAESKTRLLRDELAHLDRRSLLGEMAAALAHEINQPLATIVNFAGGSIQRIRKGNLDPEELLFALGKISEQSKLAGEIIRRIRAFLKKETTGPSAVCLETLIHQAANLLAYQADRQEVAIKLMLAPDLPPVAADRVQIQQVLVNLMLNAIQAMGNSGSRERLLTVRTRQVGEEIEVSVDDTGPGVTTEQLEQLFTPFFTTKTDGMGMGLAICRTIVEANGGRIRAERNEKGGLMFRFSLPLFKEVTYAA